MTEAVAAELQSCMRSSNNALACSAALREAVEASLITPAGASSMPSVGPSCAASSTAPSPVRQKEELNAAVREAMEASLITPAGEPSMPSVGHSCAASSTAPSRLQQKELNWLEGSLSIQPLIGKPVNATDTSLFHGTVDGSYAVTLLRVDMPNIKEACKVRKLWRELQHASVTRLLGWTAIDNSAFYVLEPLQMTLEHLIYQKPTDMCTPEVIARITYNVADGMAFLHEHGILHRALRPRAIFLTDGLVAKVGDLAVARQSFSDQNTPETGVYRYMAPEVITHKPYSSKCDVYSFGMTLYELMHCHAPFFKLNGLQAAYLVIFGQRPEINKDAIGDAHYLLEVMTAAWSENPAERPSFSQITDHIKGALLQKRQPTTPQSSLAGSLSPVVGYLTSSSRWRSLCGAARSPAVPAGFLR